MKHKKKISFLCTNIIASTSSHRISWRSWLHARIPAISYRSWKSSRKPQISQSNSKRGPELSRDNPKASSAAKKLVAYMEGTRYFVNDNVMDWLIENCTFRLFWYNILIHCTFTEYFDTQFNALHCIVHLQSSLIPNLIHCITLTIYRVFWKWTFVYRSKWCNICILNIRCFIN